MFLLSCDNNYNNPIHNCEELKMKKRYSQLETLINRTLTKTLRLSNTILPKLAKPTAQ